MLPESKTSLKMDRSPKTHHLLTSMSFQTRITYFPPWKTKEVQDVQDTKVMQVWSDMREWTNSNVRESVCNLSLEKRLILLLPARTVYRCFEGFRRSFMETSLRLHIATTIKPHPLALGMQEITHRCSLIGSYIIRIPAIENHRLFLCVISPLWARFISTGFRWRVAAVQVLIERRLGSIEKRFL